jgi:ketosteroid isomerase-like protein
MTLKEIAEALVDGCRTGKERENLDRLYHPDAVSVEAADYTGQGRETAGLDGIRGKHDWWDGAMEVHSAEVEGPFLHGDDRFAVIFDIDATDKASGQRMPMREVAVYHVADGRIVREEFFGMG